MENEKLSPPEKITLHRRDFIFKSIITLPFLGMTYQLWNLQIVQGQKYLNLSKGNRVRLRLTASPRGVIIDRYGEILATNIPSYNILMTKEDCQDKEGTLQKLSVELGIDINKLKRALAQNKHTPSFTPFDIVEDMTWDQMSYFLTFSNEFRGLEIDYISKRYYPSGRTAAHLLGYMGGIDKKTLQKVPKNKNRSSQVLGKSGIEKIHNEILIGIDGGIQIEVDNQGRNIKQLAVLEPEPGNNLQLTIDKKLQQEIEKRFQNDTGAVIMTKIETNEVLAMASMPSYDPNKFSLGINHADWNKLLAKPTKPLHDRCLQAIYSPGSTFKMLIAYAALDMGLITAESTTNCGGVYRNYGQNFSCWKRGGHGPVNVVQAIEQSCNVFFYNLGNLIGIDKIHDYAVLFGLGDITKIDLLNELSGVMPNREWKQKTYKQDWLPGETISASIGQSYVSVTPIQLLNHLNIILSDGKKRKPVVIKNVRSKENQVLSQDQEQKNDFEQITLNPEYIALIKKGMNLVVNGEKGTARYAASGYVRFGGKTGTTQVISNKTKRKFAQQGKELDKKFEDHAWFVGYSPIVNPEISIVVMIENGKSSLNAAKFAKNIFDFYWKNRNFS